GIVSGGSASANYVLPAGTPIGTYAIHAAFNFSANFATSTDNSKTLTINIATPAFSTTAAADASVAYSDSAQSVNLSATVASPAGPVNQGTVTFQLVSGGTNVGSVVTSATVSNGAALVSYSLPATTP